MTTQPDDLTTRLLTAVEAGFDQTVADLESLVRIPSVAFDGFDHSEVQRSADRTKELLEGTGWFDEVRVERVPVAEGADELGMPAVIARREPQPGYPTVLLYAHHDVQPSGDEALWQSAPFEPEVRGERIYGRGTSDDKAGVVGHVAALRALQEVLPDAGIGIAMFIEGEEEAGSKSFAHLLHTFKDTLAADVIFVADSGNWDTDTPALTVSLRGNAKFDVRVTSLEHANHSGMAGGAAPDAAMVLIRLLDSLWDDDGAVAIKGLARYDSMVPEDGGEKFRADAGVLDGVQLAGRGPVLDRLWNQPAVTVVGTDLPSVQHASNTVLGTASAVVSVRLAPGQDAAEAMPVIQHHLEEHVPFGARVEVSDVTVGSPFLADTSGPVVAAYEQAMQDAWAVEPVRTGIGGSIPFVADLTREFPEAEILITGIGDPESMLHSPNESQHLPSLRKAIAAEALLLARLAEQSAEQA